MYSRILVPLSRSELAERALYHAQTLANGHGSAVHLLHVVERDNDLDSIRGGGNANVMDLTRNLNRRVVTARMDGGTQYLKGPAARLEEAGITVETAVVMGIPADKIVEYALAKSLA